VLCGIAAEGSHGALCETELVAVGLTVSRFQPVARLCGRLIRVKLWGLALMLETWHYRDKPVTAKSPIWHRCNSDNSMLTERHSLWHVAFQSDSFRHLLKTRLFSEYTYLQHIRGIALYALYKFMTYLLSYLFQSFRRPTEALTCKMSSIDIQFKATLLGLLFSSVSTAQVQDVCTPVTAGN